MLLLLLLLSPRSLPFFCLCLYNPRTGMSRRGRSSTSRRQRVYSVPLTKARYFEEGWFCRQFRLIFYIYMWCDGFQVTIPTEDSYPCSFPCFYDTVSTASCHEGNTKGGGRIGSWRLVKRPVTNKQVVTVNCNPPRRNQDFQISGSPPKKNWWPAASPGNSIPGK